MTINDLPDRVKQRAHRLQLGGYRRTVRRRPGIPGIIVCGVLLIVAVNLLFAGRRLTSNPVMIAAAATLVVIIAWWGYVWFRRSGGGLHLFDRGFVDAAGVRMVAISHDDIESITVARTQYAIGSMPAGDGANFHIHHRVAEHEQLFVFTVNTTYADVATVIAEIAEQAGVSVTDTTQSR